MQKQWDCLINISSTLYTQITAARRVRYTDHLKKMINTAAYNWMRNNPGKTMTIHHIPGIVKEAFPFAFTDANAIAGFKCIGINPFNRNIIHIC